MHRFCLSIIIVALNILLSSCSFEARLTSVGGDFPEEVLNRKAENKEIVPVSQQRGITAAKYKVQSSVSYLNGKLEALTSKGYRVHSGVQANLLKDKNQ